MVFDLERLFMVLDGERDLRGGPCGTDSQLAMAAAAEAKPFPCPSFVPIVPSIGLQENEDKRIR